jgi:hypothetical protein
MVRHLEAQRGERPRHDYTRWSSSACHGRSCSSGGADYLDWVEPRCGPLRR